jgi:sulfite reductase (NADPH) flavoprotein alpha-component
MTSTPSIGIDQNLLRQLATQHNAQQQMWLSGYLYALATRDDGWGSIGTDLSLDQLAPAVGVGADPTRVTVLFGSQTGNSQKLAKKVTERLSQAGFGAILHDLNDYSTKNLKAEQYVLLIVSTQGEGVPPVAAESFYEWLHSARAPRLEGLAFSVCGLGDRSYLKFCQTGRDFDARLEALGGRRLYERADCDVEYDEVAEAWLEGVIGSLPQTVRNATVRSTALPAGVAGVVSKYDRKRPFEATVLEKIRLDGRGSVKETWHLELSLAESGLHYQPGDSLGIVPHNPVALVKEILYAAALDGHKIVEFEGEQAPLSQVLLRRAEVTTLNRDLIERFANWMNNAALKALLTDDVQLKTFLWGRNLADLFREYPAAMSEQTLASMLRKLAPRLYSIASSEAAHPDEVHLTVAAVRYLFNQRPHWGAASTHLADQLEVGSTVSVFVEENTYFKLPDDDKDIIMVGPGTGIAPFRAFVEERTERGATGRNWLFFGNPHFETDFLYQTEWLNHLKRGTLDRLDVAFSRDQADKIYVQHRLLERAKLIYERLENGAYFYVCGDKERMASDVQNAVRQVIAQESGQGAEYADEYLRNLKKQRRYLEDVY